MTAFASSVDRRQASRHWIYRMWVVTSQLNSCDRNSSLRPTGPPSAEQRTGRARHGLMSRSSSSRMSALVASSRPFLSQAVLYLETVIEGHGGRGDLVLEPAPGGRVAAAARMDGREAQQRGDLAHPGSEDAAELDAFGARGSLRAIRQRGVQAGIYGGSRASTRRRRSSASCCSSTPLRPRMPSSVGRSRIDLAGDLIEGAEHAVER